MDVQSVSTSTHTRDHEMATYYLCHPLVTVTIQMKSIDVDVKESKPNLQNIGWTKSLPCRHASHTATWKLIKTPLRSPDLHWCRRLNIESRNISWTTKIKNTHLSHESVIYLWSDHQAMCQWWCDRADLKVILVGYLVCHIVYQIRQHQHLSRNFLAWH